MAGAPIVYPYDPPSRPSRSPNGLPLVDLYSGLGHEPTPLPKHLTRVLYIPEHEAPGFPVYESTREFQRVIYESPFGRGELMAPPLMGSRMFNLRMSVLNRPSGNGRDNVQYLVGPDTVLGDDGHMSVNVRKRDPHNICPDVNVKLPLQDHNFSLTISCHKEPADTTLVRAFFPLPDAQSYKTTIFFPYFAFSSRSGHEWYQWEVHPIQDGPMRYTLVSNKGRSEDTSRRQEGDIRAIYYHVGRGGSVFQPHSEGILLLPETSVDGPELEEEVVVASLIGVLTRVRSMRYVEKSKKTSSKHRDKPLFKRLFR
ncbi:hypothetical protein G3M48_000650 [Beauveria asiatica]|uniref:Uncharacterized protein n=1 Tax=Beauveria asiatica TaxID=1069075 RepID=A0AAW0S170_9HYPO